MARLCLSEAKLLVKQEGKGSSEAERQRIKCQDQMQLHCMIKGSGNQTLLNHFLVAQRQPQGQVLALISPLFTVELPEIMLKLLKTRMLRRGCGAEEFEITELS
uniref:Uncharacterized protein n=1 Tax=Opuntia streptacantha TaxID=393608 RepID=A0A7C9D546_OPUST